MSPNDNTGNFPKESQLSGRFHWIFRCFRPLRAVSTATKYFTFRSWTIRRCSAAKAGKETLQNTKKRPFFEERFLLPQ